jgi:hypothetical protein
MIQQVQTFPIGAPQRLAIVSVRNETWIEKLRQHTEAQPEGWFRLCGLGRSEAEQLLDWLENQAVRERELTFDEQGGFTVRWRPQLSDNGSRDCAAANP